MILIEIKQTKILFQLVCTIMWHMDIAYNFSFYIHCYRHKKQNRNTIKIFVFIMQLQNIIVLVV